MAGYLGTKAALLSTTAASVGGDATIGGDLTVDTNTLHVDSTNNNVGIGTSSPSYKLSLGGEATAFGSLLYMEETSHATSERAGMQIGGWVVGQDQAGSGTKDFFFYDGNTSQQRLLIDTSGNLLVGTTGAIAGKTAKAGIYQTNAAPVIACYTNTTGTINQIIFANPNGEIGNINSGATSVSYNTSSDYRLKEDVQPMVGATDRVLALNPVNFAWKVNGERVDGFLAHEAQAVVPEAVTGERDAVDDEGNPKYQGIDQSKLVPLLTAALQEAIAKIETLETEMTSVKSRLDALEGN